MKYSINRLVIMFFLLGSISFYAAADNIFANEKENNSRWSPVSSQVSVTTNGRGGASFSSGNPSGMRMSGGTVSRGGGFSYQRAASTTQTRTSSTSTRTSGFRSSSLGNIAVDRTGNFKMGEIAGEFASSEPTGTVRELGTAGNEGHNPGLTTDPSLPVGDAILPLTLMILAFGVWKWRKMH